MNFTKYFFIILLIFQSIYTVPELKNESRKKLLIINTENNDPYFFNNFLKYASNAGFNSDVINFYDIENKSLNNYDAVFLFISPLFLNNQDNKLVSDVIKKINKFSQSGQKILSLVFPYNTIIKKQFLLAKKFLKRLISRKTLNKHNKLINKYLKINIYKSYDYLTALPVDIENKSNNELETNSFCSIDESLKINSSLLPMNSSFYELQKSTFSTGLYLKDKKDNNHIFISKIPLLLFDECSEDFRINPIDKKIRNDLIAMKQQALYELKMISDQNSESIIKNLPLLPLTKTENSIRSKSNKKFWCGWLDLDAYDGDNLEKGIENILKANLNILWIRFNPEFYLSKNAILAEKKDEFLNRIDRFTKALKEKCQTMNKPVPQIFIGTEITGNFRKILVENPMQDIFKNVYTKIPAPFDYENLWKTELFQVLDDFFNEWKKIGNGLEISGIFFDFEMYHAQDQESGYPGLSDFSENSLEIYRKKTGNKKINIDYLIKQKQLNEYFVFLKKEAQLLGKKILEHIKTKLPNIMIGVYMPNISTDWFYLGMLAGLSTADNPLILATFNNDFFSHENWLRSNNIYAYHLSCILLSNIKDENSFTLIDDIKKEHNGIWFNRFSRLGHVYDADRWWISESTPFDHDLIINAIGKKLR